MKKTTMLLATILLLLTAIPTTTMAQTTNYTFTLDGSNCSVYGCHIQPAGDTDSPWGTGLPAFPPDHPFWYVSAHATFTTGLPIKINAYPPSYATGTGTGTINWFIGNGQSGTFNITLNCTWQADGKLGNYPRFLETCESAPDSQGQSAPFTRGWYATQGPRGGWNLFVINMPAQNIMPQMTLTMSVPNQ